METFECLMTRRTIRRYSDAPVGKGDLEKILDAVRMAPSWANSQCVFLVAVDDPKTKSALQETLPKGNPARNAVVDAPYVIALCAKKGLSGFYNGKEVTPFGDWFLFDAGIAVQNLALAAHAMGYGVVNVGLMDQNAAGSILGLDENSVCIELLPLGRPAEDQPQAPARKPMEEFAYRNRFANPL